MLEMFMYVDNQVYKCQCNEKSPYCFFYLNLTLVFINMPKNVFH
jgi:hypothetical protein